MAGLSKIPISSVLSALHRCQASSDQCSKPRTTRHTFGSSLMLILSAMKWFFHVSSVVRSDRSTGEEDLSFLTSRIVHAQFALSLFPQPCQVLPKMSRRAGSTSVLQEQARSDLSVMVICPSRKRAKT